jgi:hypothetical protein
MIAQCLSRAWPPKVELPSNVALTSSKYGEIRPKRRPEMAKRYSAKLKFQVVLEVLEGEKSIG